MSNDSSSAEADGLTIIQARGRRLAKLVQPEGTSQGYDSARLFDLHSVQVPDMSALVALLTRLGAMPDCAVVRGAILDPARTRRVRRLLHADPKTGDAPTLRDAQRAWVAIDMDSVTLPRGCDWRDLQACAEVARSVLPRAFHAAALVVVATAGHGFKPGARLRAWALLDTPLSGAEVTAWMRGVPCDSSVFRPVQPIYTAAPVFCYAVDPLPDRLVLLPGRERVVCPSPSSLAPKPRVTSSQPPEACEAGAGQYAATALARATVAVATAKVDERHRTAVQESWRLAKLVGAGLLSASAVERAMDGALERAGKPAGEGAAVAAWAVAQRGGRGVQR